jgi:regulator of sirC expression with transglutaminase-like and TPR domain
MAKRILIECQRPRSRFRKIAAGVLAAAAIASIIATCVMCDKLETCRAEADSLRKTANMANADADQTRAEMAQLRKAFVDIGGYGNEIEKTPAMQELRRMLDGPEADINLTRAHFLVAAGIPEYLGLDIEQQVAEVQKLADYVRSETVRNYARHKAEGFRESFGREEQYKIGILATVLNDDVKIRYIKGAPDHRKPDTLFVNGLLQTKSGTCVSMPMLYVLIGERLGYPIRLVAIKDHYFCRWDDGKFASNIEATTGGGIADDAKYAADFKLAAGEIKDAFWLKSMNKKQTVAQFLASRASYWTESIKRPQAIADLRLAASLCPMDPYIINHLTVLSAVRMPAGPSNISPVADPLYYARQAAMQNFNPMNQPFPGQPNPVQQQGTSGNPTRPWP